MTEELLEQLYNKRAKVRLTQPIRGCKYASLTRYGSAHDCWVTSLSGKKTLGRIAFCAPDKMVTGGYNGQVHSWPLRNVHEWVSKIEGELRAK